MRLHSLPAFTLIELSLVLIITGVLFTTTLPLVNIFWHKQKQQNTWEHQEQIVYALAAYVNQHYHLPPPANPLTAPLGTADYSTCGRESCQGLVPYRTLGLSEVLVKDGYHHWFTYVVPANLVRNHGLQKVEEGDESFCGIEINNLILLDTNGQEFLLDTTGDLWAVILISHNLKGEGAYKPNPRLGVTLPIDENSNHDQIFTHASSAKVKAVTRNNLMAFYGHNPCRRQENHARRGLR